MSVSMLRFTHTTLSHPTSQYNQESIQPIYIAASPGSLSNLLYFAGEPRENSAWLCHFIAVKTSSLTTHTLGQLACLPDKLMETGDITHMQFFYDILHPDSA